VFTLNRAVNTGEELEVFVNNVQQEPGVGKSYTATGTTLTFDAAPSSGTGNIYVIYRGLAEVTRRLEHDPNAALAATTGTFSGGITVDKNGATVATFDRATSDGSIVDFQKSGTTVGSIASRSGIALTVNSQSGNGNLAYGGTNYVEWNNTRLGVATDNTIDLGRAAGRWKDLYLSGGVYLGGTGSTNYLDDYEEGTWTPTGSTSGGTAPSFESVSGTYTKIGRLVTINATIINITAGDTTNEQVQVAGLPFTPDVQDGLGACNFGQVTITSAIGVVAQASYIYDRVIFFMNRTNLGRTAVDNQHISSGVSDAWFTISYITDQ
jgi:hypothetical protein